MQQSKRKANFLFTAIQAWQAEGLLSEAQGDNLRSSIVVVAFDWKRLAKYSFWTAVICLLMAVSAVLADKAIMALLARLFGAPAWVKCGFFAGWAAWFYWRGVRRRRAKPEKIFSNETLFFLGILATAAAIFFLGEAVASGSKRFHVLFLLAALVYAGLGLWFPSKLTWVFALLSLGAWFGARSGYMSGWGAYYFGMNYPLRFVLFGAMLTAGSAVFRFIPQRRDFSLPSRVMGLLYLFLALWILSIFGNYGDMTAWNKASQLELFHWALLFGAVAILAVWYGLKFDDQVTRGFGLTFLFINLYTRFFEFFWDTIHKALFFAILAASFWLLGSRAEKIWNLSVAAPRNTVEP